MGACVCMCVYVCVCVCASCEEEGPGKNGWRLQSKQPAWTVWKLLRCNELKVKICHGHGQRALDLIPLAIDWELIVAIAFRLTWFRSQDLPCRARPHTASTATAHACSMTIPLVKSDAKRSVNY